MIQFILGIAVGITATLLFPKFKTWFVQEKKNVDEKFQELDKKFKDKI